MNKTLEHLCSNGFALSSITLDGKIHRFDRNGKNNAWYIGWIGHLARTGEPYEICQFGDWKTGEEHTFRSVVKYTKEDRQIIDKQMREASKRALEEKKKRQEETATECSYTFKRATANASSEYLKRKKIEGLHGTKTELTDRGRAVLVPMHDIDGKLWGLQRIFPDGKKLFTPGQRVEGCFHLIGAVLDEIYLCEGFATGASIFQATGKPVAVAFNASNLEPVARELRRKFPEAGMVICGDDDAFLEDGNVGREKAEEAAKRHLGHTLFPKFKDLSTKPTDFNDLYCLEGAEEVRRQILGEVPEKHYVRALGYDGDHYFYTSSSNKKILRLSASSHTSSHLQDLMPNEYWEALFPGRFGVDWSRAASSLMSQGRARGYFSTEKIRGTGVWEENGRVILNLGDRLWSEGRELPLVSQKYRNVYQMGRTIKAPHPEPLSVVECREILDCVSNLNWHRKESRIFFAGFLAICRMSGILKWRPHLWLTGGAGTGKTTVMEHLVRPFVGDLALAVLGNTTEAGIRHAMGSDARAVVFDEIETLDLRSDMRIKGVLDLVRHASSDSEAVIVKGTPNGTALQYRARSCFVFSSIRVNLQSEADATRFTVCELTRGGTPEQWERLKRKLENVTQDYADRLFSRSLHMWPVIKQNMEAFEEVLAARFSARFAQQYGTLLSGFASLTSDEALSREDAKALCDQLEFEEEKVVLEDTDELEALRALMCRRVSVDTATGKQDRSIGDLVREENDSALQLYGLRIHREAGKLYALVASSHPELKQLYRDTKWCAGWAKSLARIPGATGSGLGYFGGTRQRCVKVPVYLDALAGSKEDQ